MTTVPASPAGVRTRVSAFFFRHPWLKLALLVLPPLIWMVVVYLGALGMLLRQSFFHLDPLSGKTVHQYGLDNFRTLLDTPLYREITIRTVTYAVLTTVIDALLAFPLAYYMWRIASPRMRAALFVAVVLPLWSSYLIKIYTWRLIFATDGPLNWSAGKIGLDGLALANTRTAVVITFCYIWLPFMILPVYAALSRIPPSLIEASGDLGARSRTTFRRVVLPMALPGVAAGSIFTFSLTLGDYIVPQLVSSKTQVIGNVIFGRTGLAQDLPFAAAYSVVPIVVVVVYLLIMKRIGAFEAL